MGEKIKVRSDEAKWELEDEGEEEEEEGGGRWRTGLLGRS